MSKYEYVQRLGRHAYICEYCGISSNDESTVKTHENECKNNKGYSSSSRPVTKTMAQRDRLREIQSWNTRDGSHSIGTHNYYSHYNQEPFKK